MKTIHTSENQETISTQLQAQTSLNQPLKNPDFPLNNDYLPRNLNPESSSPPKPEKQCSASDMQRITSFLTYRQMSVALKDMLLISTDINDTDFRVYEHLHNKIDFTNDRAERSARSIAKAINRSKSAVQRSLRKLVRLHFLNIERGYNRTIKYIDVRLPQSWSDELLSGKVRAQAAPSFDNTQKFYCKDASGNNIVAGYFNADGYYVLAIKPMDNVTVDQHNMVAGVVMKCYDYIIQGNQTDDENVITKVTHAAEQAMSAIVVNQSTDKTHQLEPAKKQLPSTKNGSHQLDLNQALNLARENAAHDVTLNNSPMVGDAHQEITAKESLEIEELKAKSKSIIEEMQDPTLTNKQKYELMQKRNECDNQIVAIQEDRLVRSRCGAGAALPSNIINKILICASAGEYQNRNKRVKRKKTKKYDEKFVRNSHLIPEFEKSYGDRKPVPISPHWESQIIAEIEKHGDSNPMQVKHWILFLMTHNFVNAPSNLENPTTYQIESHNYWIAIAMLRQDLITEPTGIRSKAERQKEVHDENHRHDHVKLRRQSNQNQSVGISEETILGMLGDAKRYHGSH